MLGGAPPELDGALREGLFWSPTAFEASNDHRVAREEIFGPVATFVRFETEARSDRAGQRQRIRLSGERVVARISDVPTASPARIRSGTVAINTPYAIFPGVPFGGYKQSGYGRELGMETMAAYSETKSVLTYVGEKPMDPFRV